MIQKNHRLYSANSAIICPMDGALLYPAAFHIALFKVISKVDNVLSTAVFASIGTMEISSL